MNPHKEDCDCEFDVNEQSEDEKTSQTAWHYKRVCPYCNTPRWSLHCWHDRIEWHCHVCNTLVTDVRPE